jgi:hypothetical protein
LGGVDERVKRGLDEGVTFGGVPFPIELKFKFEARIVGLVAGGWCELIFLSFELRLKRCGLGHSTHWTIKAECSFGVSVLSVSEYFRR